MNDAPTADGDVEATTNHPSGPQTAGSDCDDCPRMMGRRKFLATTAAAGAALAAGTGSAAAQTADEAINWAYERTHDPYIPGTITVDLHGQQMAELDHIADDGTVESLHEKGYVLAAPTDEDTPHNPVTFQASDLVATTTNDDGSLSVGPLSEYTAFPRDVQYDEDSSGDAETDVSILDATHWTVDESGISTSGATMTVQDGSNDTLELTATDFASGDVGTATFDLTSVGATDATITSGVERKFLQLVRDIPEMTSGVTVEYALQDSTGAELVATDDPSGDGSTTSVLATSTGPSQVDEARVGELGSLEDITALVIRVKDADVSETFHGMNLGRETSWTFGTQEYTNSDDELDTQDVTQPSGEFSVTSLATLEGTPFETAGIRNITYDVEQRASELGNDEVWARRQEAGAYDRDEIVEVVVPFESASAYDLSVAVDSLMDVQEWPGGRYLSVEVASGIPEFEDWTDIEDYSGWNARTSRYDGTVGSDVEAYSTPTTSERSGIRIRMLQDTAEADQYFGGGTAPVAGSSGGGNIISKAKGVLMTAVLSVLALLGLRSRGD